MRKLISLLIIIAGSYFFASCTKDSQSERFKLLTGPVWLSDSLLANGIDAGGLDGALYKFKGEAKFNEDGSGKFGKYDGKWRFAFDETQIVITSDSLPIPLTTVIAELKNTSLKITTSYQIPIPINIRMTFKAKE